MRLSRRLLLPLVLALGTTAATLVPEEVSAHEGTLFGVRTGLYTKQEQPFAGVELVVPLGHDLWANPNAEYVFGDGRTFMTFNMDFHYDFYSHRRAFVWVGAGLGVVYVNPTGPPPSSTDVAANFLAGVGLSGGPVIPYVQVKVIAKGDTEAVLAFGLRF